jgi:Aminoglycoside-2''-adenylyltransferase
MRPLDLDLGTWDAWSPAEAAEHLRGVSTPWYVLAGWALDLFIGRQTRAHDDLEIGVPADGFEEIRSALGGFEFVVVGDGRAWPVTERTLRAHGQTWVREPGGPWRLDVIRERWDEDVWVYRRDARIRLPVKSLISRTNEGIPFVRPEVVLLFKAKAPRPKDTTDLEAVLPHLDDGRRAWLRSALALAHPDHVWLARLSR